MRIGAVPVVGLALLAVGCCAVDVDEEAYDIVQGDIQVPRGSRLGDALGGTPIGTERLFPLGEAVRFVIDASLGTSNDRITSAIATWQLQTCFTFEKCAVESACQKPFIRFQLGDGCSSLVGRSSTGLNRIVLAPACSIGAVIHEIGHALGLSHEQSRLDRDQYVTVVEAQVQPDAMINFDKNPDGSRDLGPYDYGSIMHYGPTEFAIGTTPSIISPQPIGQRDHLSAGDIATMHFLYNECSAVYAAPRCMASVDETVTHMVQHSQTWSFTFNGVYDPQKTMRVSYGMPPSSVSHSIPAGSRLSDAATVQVQFTPTSAMRGEKHTLTATFTSRDDASSATCTVEVQVAGCAQNVAQDFEVASDAAAWTGGVADTFAAGGSGSLRVGAEDCSLVSVDKAVMQLPAVRPTERLTAHMAVLPCSDGQNRPVMLSLTHADTTCFTVRITPSGELFVGQSLVRTGLSQRTFYFIDTRINWGLQKLTVYVDGQLAVENNPFDAVCHTGADRAVLSGNGWMDTFRLWCTDYVALSGPLVGATQDVLRAGGATLTLSLATESNAWVDSADNRRAVAEAFVSSLPASQDPTGWNALRSQLFDASLVTFTFNGRVATIGPLKAVPQYLATADQVVSLQLTDAMFTTGKAPLNAGSTELTFPLKETATIAPTPVPTPVPTGPATPEPGTQLVPPPVTQAEQGGATVLDCRAVCTITDGHETCTVEDCEGWDYYLLKPSVSLILAALLVLTCVFMMCCWTWFRRCNICGGTAASDQFCTTWRPTFQEERKYQQKYFDHGYLHPYHPCWAKFVWPLIAVALMASSLYFGVESRGGVEDALDSISTGLRFETEAYFGPHVDAIQNHLVVNGQYYVTVGGINTSQVAGQVVYARSVARNQVDEVEEDVDSVDHPVIEVASWLVLFITAPFVLMTLTLACCNCGRNHSRCGNGMTYFVILLACIASLMMWILVGGAVVAIDVTDDFQSEVGALLPNATGSRGHLYGDYISKMCPDLEAITMKVRTSGPRQASGLCRSLLPYCSTSETYSEQAANVVFKCSAEFIASCNQVGGPTWKWPDAARSVTDLPPTDDIRAFTLKSGVPTSIRGSCSSTGCTISQCSLFCEGGTKVSAFDATDALNHGDSLGAYLAENLMVLADCTGMRLAAYRALEPPTSSLDTALQESLYAMVLSAVCLLCVVIACILGVKRWIVERKACNNMPYGDAQAKKEAPQNTPYGEAEQQQQQQQPEL